MAKKRKERYYNHGTMTKAELMSMILSALRRLGFRWKPRIAKLNEGRRPYEGKNKRQKWEYHCEGCEGWFSQKEIDMDHVIPCGGINDFEKISDWCKRHFVEIKGFQRLCKRCHNEKTQREKKK